MAVGAGFGFLRSYRMRNEGAEGFSAEAFCGDSLLRVVEPVAVVVLRAYEHGASGPHGSHAVTSYSPVYTQSVHIVAQNLEVVGRPVARCEAFVVQHGFALVGRHGEVAAVAGRRPGRVAGVAGHLAVLVREFGRISGNVAP